MNCLILVLLFLGSEVSGEWKPLTVGKTSKITYDPETMVVEFAIVPKKTLKNLDFSLSTRLFDESHKLLGVTSFAFDMKGTQVTKSAVRLGVKSEKSDSSSSGSKKKDSPSKQKNKNKDGKNPPKRCHDGTILNKNVPENMLQDFTNPNVFVIDELKSPDFAGNKACNRWRKMMAENTIEYIELALWSSGWNISPQLDITFKVRKMITTSTLPPLLPFSTTPTTEAFNNIIATKAAAAASGGDICSIYPGGVVDTFDKESLLYDLMCYHVLAASYGSTSWFIYGSYDEFDGKKSCGAMAIYVGTRSFEVMRGWMINYGGKKVDYVEGEEKEVAGTGCVAYLKNLYLTVDCRPAGYPFIIHHDGYMQAHIELFERSKTEIGLCFGNNSGERLNWQITNKKDTRDCTISSEISDCKEADPHCAEFENSCDDSLVRSCRELFCGESRPTSEQICSLSQAKKKKCQLRGSKLDDALTGCPTDVCLRKYFVLGTGCPQDPFFTGCPIENYLDTP